MPSARWKGSARCRANKNSLSGCLRKLAKLGAREFERKKSSRGGGESGKAAKIKKKRKKKIIVLACSRLVYLSLSIYLSVGVQGCALFVSARARARALVCVCVLCVLPRIKKNAFVVLISCVSGFLFSFLSLSPSLSLSLSLRRRGRAQKQEDLALEASLSLYLFLLQKSAAR